MPKKTIQTKRSRNLHSQWEQFKSSLTPDATGRGFKAPNRITKISGKKGNPGLEAVYRITVAIILINLTSTLVGLKTRDAISKEIKRRRFFRYSGFYRYPVESPQPSFPGLRRILHSSIVDFSVIMTFVPSGIRTRDLLFRDDALINWATRLSPYNRRIRICTLGLMMELKLDSLF